MCYRSTGERGSLRPFPAEPISRSDVPPPGQELVLLRLLCDGYRPAARPQWRQDVPSAPPRAAVLAPRSLCHRGSCRSPRQPPNHAVLLQVLGTDGYLGRAGSVPCALSGVGVMGGRRVRWGRGSHRRPAQTPAADGAGHTAGAPGTQQVNPERVPRFGHPRPIHTQQLWATSPQKPQDELSSPPAPGSGAKCSHPCGGLGLGSRWCGRRGGRRPQGPDGVQGLHGPVLLRSGLKSMSSWSLCYDLI